MTNGEHQRFPRKLLETFLVVSFLRYQTLLQISEMWLFSFDIWFINIMSCFMSESWLPFEIIFCIILLSSPITNAAFQIMKRSVFHRDYQHQCNQQHQHKHDLYLKSSDKIESQNKNIYRRPCRRGLSAAAMELEIREEIRASLAALRRSSARMFCHTSKSQVHPLRSLSIQWRAGVREERISLKKGRRSLMMSEMMS